MENVSHIETVKKDVASHVRVLKRVVAELMFPLDDFSEIISSRKHIFVS